MLHQKPLSSGIFIWIVDVRAVDWLYDWKYNEDAGKPTYVVPSARLVPILEIRTQRCVDV